MPSDPVMDLHAQGLSAREIGERTGKTRNAVLGYIWRYKARNGPPVPNQPRVSDEAIQTSLERHGYNLTAAAREVGLTQSALYRRGFKGRSIRHDNAATDPATRALVEEIGASGLSDRFITYRVNMGANNIYHWRRGKHVASPFLAQCVREAISDAAQTR